MIKFIDKAQFYITILIAAIVMMFQIIRMDKWERLVDSMVIPPKIKKEDRVWKYN